MRTLVQPPPSLRCDLCQGELRFKRIDPDGPLLELDYEVFVCMKCGHERTYRAKHDPYAARSEANEPPVKVSEASAGSRPLSGNRTAAPSPRTSR